MTSNIDIDNLLRNRYACVSHCGLLEPNYNAAGRSVGRKVLGRKRPASASYLSPAVIVAAVVAEGRPPPPPDERGTRQQTPTGRPYAHIATLHIKAQITRQGDMT